MKKLMFTSMLALAFVVCMHTTSGQGISVELDLGYNVPGGDFADAYDGGVGIAIHPRLKLGGNMAAGLSLGVNGFAGVDQSGGVAGTGDVSAVGVTTVMGTFQYKLFDRNITPYAEIGVGFWNGEIVSADLTNAATGNVPTESVSSVGFSPEIGFMLSFLNVYAAYTVAGDFNYVQAGLGFRFGSK